MDYEKLTQQLDAFAKEHEKESRYEHSVRVAEMCARICRYYGLDERKGYLAGIAHDICKDFSVEELLELAKKDGDPILEFEAERPKLLHGRAAAIVMKEQFGINDKDILEAVANHTSGVLGMCDLTRCLFLADKIEPGRPQSTEEYRNRLFKLSLDEMFYSVFEENYFYVLNKGFEIYPSTEKMLKYYKEICEK